MGTRTVLHLVLVDLRVAEDLLDGVSGAAEEVQAKLLETHKDMGGVEVDALVERVDADGGLSLRGYGSLRSARKRCKDGGGRVD